jgi:general secretion pathway protein C
VLDSPANPQSFYRLNEKLPDGSRIVKVKRDSVSLKREDGSITVLEMVDDTKIVMATPTANASSGVRQLSKDKWMLDQREVAASSENMSQILTQARALPYMEAGKTVGFRISEIVAGSIYEKIGIKNGDVIQKVNAQDVDDPGKFFQLYQGLKEEKNITIDLMRNGQRQTLSYEIR